VPGGYGLANWTHLGSVTAGTTLRVDPLEAVVNSLLSATIAATAAVVLGLTAARVAVRRPGGAADRVLLLPLGVSATTIGLGLLLAFGHPPLDLRRSLWIVPLAQTLVALPLVVRAVLPALRALPPSLVDAGALLGVGRAGRFWRIELPAVRPAVVAGAGLAFVACMGEFGATVFLARADRPTVSVAIERLMSRPGGAGFGQAMALSCILVLVCTTVLVLVDRRRAGRDGLDLSF
jgi:thiamine transport system permease protein